MSQTFRILLVEDDDSLRACLGDFLQGQDWDVGATGHPAEALQMASQQRFDFSLLDFHLPELTGVELLQQLKSVRPLPSILMSGQASAAEVAAAQQAGFFAFLRKPLDLGRLRDSLQNLIRSHFGGPLAPWNGPTSGPLPCERPARFAQTHRGRRSTQSRRPLNSPFSLSNTPFPTPKTPRRN